MIEMAPDMELFLDRNAGLMVLFSILLAGKEDDIVAAAPPGAALDLGASRSASASRARTSVRCCAMPRLRT